MHGHVKPETPRQILYANPLAAQLRPLAAQTKPLFAQLRPLAREFVRTKRCFFHHIFYLNNKVFKKITIFGCAEDRMRLGNVKIKNKFFLAIALAFHYLCVSAKKYNAT